MEATVPKVDSMEAELQIAAVAAPEEQPVTASEVRSVPAVVQAALTWESFSSHDSPVLLELKVKGDPIWDCPRTQNLNPPLMSPATERWDL